ncbi:MAG: nitroreductase family protein [Spirochaetia bacterium]
MKRLKLTEFIRSLRKLIKQQPMEMPRHLRDNPVLKLLWNRRSVRSFMNRAVQPEVLSIILEAGRLAPSGVNLQSWSFGVFSRGSWKEKFGSSIPFNGENAVIIMGDVHRARSAISEFPRQPLVEYTLAVLNAGIAAYAMNIAAEACGISSIMLSDTGRTGFYDAMYLKDKLDLPEGVFPLTTLVLGYAKKIPPASPPKLPMDTVSFTGSYKESDPEVLRSWLNQMQAGYRASMITKSFSGQLKHYRSRADKAEEGLRNIIFFDSGDKESGDD